MKKRTGFYVVNMSSVPLKVKSKENKLYTIKPREKFIILDSWKENNDFIFEVYFKGEDKCLSLGYLHNPKYISQLCLWSQLASKTLSIENGNKLSVFKINKTLKVYDKLGGTIRVIAPNTLVASYMCKSHPIYNTLVSIDYVKLKGKWTYIGGFIDSEIDMDAINTTMDSNVDKIV